MGSNRAIDGKPFKFTVHPALGVGSDVFELAVTVCWTPCRHSDLTQVCHDLSVLGLMAQVGGVALEVTCMFSSESSMPALCQERLVVLTGTPQFFG